MHEDRGYGLRNWHGPDRRSRLSRDVAMNPVDRVGGREGKLTGERCVKRDAERIEVAAGVDGPVHAPRLLRRHVGERPGNRLGRRRLLMFFRQHRRNAEPSQMDGAGRHVDNHIGRLDVLVNEAPIVQLADCAREGDGKAQELRQGQLLGQILQRLASLILQCKDDASVAPRQGKRTQGEGGVQKGAQLVFMFKSAQDARSRTLGDRHDTQDEVAVLVGTMPRKHELAVPT